MFPSHSVEVLIGFPTDSLLSSFLAVSGLLFSRGVLLVRLMLCIRGSIFCSWVVRVGQIFIGLKDLLEFVFILVFAGIGVVLFGELKELCLDLLVGGGGCNPQHPVVLFEFDTTHTVIDTFDQKHFIIGWQKAEIAFTSRFYERSIWRT